MKRKLLLTVFLAAASWSVSSLATADWATGSCPSGGTAPCIEAEVSGTTYHFNGSGDHAGEWHGLPNNGEDLQFSGPFELSCSGLTYGCDLAWGAKISKCQDSSGEWRIGWQVNSAQMTGSFICNVFVLSGFPWYTKDSSVSSHCPFNDSCDNFAPYDANASSYTSNIGTIDISVLGISRLDSAHIHGMVFTPGAGANFTFNSTFYDCDEENQGCEADGTLVLQNATSLDIQ